MTKAMIIKELVGTEFHFSDYGVCGLNKNGDVIHWGEVCKVEIDNGDYVIQGEGESIPDGDNGDLIVRVQVEPHKLYRRDGVDLYCDARISMVDATLGTEIDVKTLEKTQKLKIESGTQPNSILKIKSQGLPSQNSNRRGDLFVHVVIEIPKKLSKQQKSLLDEFQNSD